MEVFLLATIAKGSLDPKVLIQQSACMSCLSEKQARDVSLFLLCQIANA
jgi:hypothetical protein